MQKKGLSIYVEILSDCLTLKVVIFLSTQTSFYYFLVKVQKIENLPCNLSLSYLYIQLSVISGSSNFNLIIFEF